MARPTDLQKRLIEELVSEMQYWSTSNDIHSPSHESSISNDMLSINDDYDLGDGPKAKEMEAIAEKMAELWWMVSSLEPSGR